MRFYIIAAFVCLFASLSVKAEVSVEQCVQKALANYPAIRKYGLLSSLEEISLSDINKGWLPRVNVYGQVTAQNVVPAFPDALSNVLEQMGQDIKGLGKVQYKVGVDLSQTIWDGGASKIQRELVRAEDAVQKSSLDVELYRVRQKVENLYFAILLTEEQIAQSEVTRTLLNNNLDKFKAMLRHGAAMQSDVDMIEAQTLSVNQSILQARSAANGYRRALEIFTGESIQNEALAMPMGVVPSDTISNRPELSLFERRQEYNSAYRRLADAAIMPHIGFFAQAYYGYPGFNYFQSMMKRDMTFNILAGIKVSWNIDSFYTKKNAYGKTAIKGAEISADKEVFLFNSRIQTATQNAAIEGLKEMMKDDGRIVALRTSVRKAAESQLDNGIIDATALLQKISEENTAMLTSKYHEILLLQEIYKLKYTLDR